MEKLQFVLKVVRQDYGSMHAPPVARRIYAPGTIHEAGSEFPLLVYALPEDRNARLKDVCVEYDPQQCRLMLCQAQGLIPTVKLVDTCAFKSSGYHSLLDFEGHMRTIICRVPGSTMLIGRDGLQQQARGCTWLLALREVQVDREQLWSVRIADLNLLP